MNKSFILFLIIFISLIVQSANAINVKTLYQSEIPVNNQSDAERLTAIQTAFDNVLVKVSGNVSIISNEKIQSSKKTAASLVEEYGYSTIPTALKKTTPYLLNIRFDAQAINQLLREASEPIWGQNRPLILLWIDSELPGRNPEILSNDSTNAVSELFKHVSTQRGLPLLLPLMDMTDMNHVSVTDIATVSTPNLLNAAKRYGSDALLIGRIQLDNTGYKTEWTLLNGSNQWHWAITDHNVENIVQTIIDRTTELVAANHAVVTTNTIQTHVRLRITGIAEQADFARLISYLNHLAPVANVNIAKISGDEMILNISLRSTDEAFIQSLSTSKKLIPLSTPDDSQLLAYEWKS